MPVHLRKVLTVKEEENCQISRIRFLIRVRAFTGERDRLGVRGLLPPRSLSMEEQLLRVRHQLNQEETPVRKALYLRELHDRNETLFHRILVDNLKELAPIVYTPTVGDVCVQFGHNFRRPRGMYFSSQDRGDMASMVYNWPGDSVHVAVVTDGGRILGLGDQGVNGMGIPIGKLALYCAAGGIAPHRVLPVMFDAGTDNEKLLADPFYLGMKHKRLRGDEKYYDMLDEFVYGLTHRYPNVFFAV